MLEILQSGSKKAGEEGTPGPKVLLFGDLQMGYYGETASSEFITGFALASAIGLTVGTAQNNTEGWLKFAYQGKTLYMAKKTFRHTVSWNQLNALGIVYGTKTAMIAGKTYKVRLMRMSDTDPGPITNIGGELRDLFAKVRLAATTTPIGQATGEWDSFDNIALGLASPTVGLLSVGTEAWSGGSSYVLRTNDYTFSYALKTSTPSSYGWRPVLELI